MVNDEKLKQMRNIQRPNVIGNVLPVETLAFEDSSTDRFIWLEDALESRGLKAVDAAAKIGVHPSSVSHWISSLYLGDALMRKKKRDDVAYKIAAMLEGDEKNKVRVSFVQVVRQQIFLFLEKGGKVPKGYKKRYYRSTIREFEERMNQTLFYDEERMLTPYQLELIYHLIETLKAI